jgi:hypothetical protein
MTDVLQPAFVPSVETDRLAVDTLRFLAADMVQAANSGHPGMPMGAAPMAWTLWSPHLRHDPTAPGTGESAIRWASWDIRDCSRDGKTRVVIWVS